MVTQTVVQQRLYSKKIRLMPAEMNRVLPLRQDAEPIDWRDLRRARGRAVGLEESGASCARLEAGWAMRKSIAHGADHTGFEPIGDRNAGSIRQQWHR